MKKLNKNIISCSSSLVYWLLLCWFWYSVPLYSLPIEECLLHKFFFCTICVYYGIMWVNFLFLNENWSWATFCLKKYIQNSLWINLTIYCNTVCILNITVKNYNLAPVIVSMETKLFKSEYGLCILKIQNSRDWRNIFCI